MTVYTKSISWNWLFSLLFTALMGISVTSSAQIKKTELVLNPLDSHEIQSYFDIGFIFYLESGEVRMTKGFLEGTVDWSEIQVSSSNTMVHEGWISFSRYQLNRDHYKVDITVESKRHGRLLQDTFEVPHFYRFTMANERGYILPGEDLRLEIFSEYSNGSIYSSITDDLITWDDFSYFVNGRQVDPTFYYVPFDPDSPKVLNVKAVYKNDPGINYTLRLPIKYPDVWNLNFTGMSGQPGDNGSHGVARSTSREFYNLHGENGQWGQNGQDGSNINLIFRAVPKATDTVLQVLIVTDTTYRYLELMTSTNELILNLNGGDGGRGGNGGRGVDAFMVGEKMKVLSGSGGNGGVGGDGGDGGESFLFTDSFGQYFTQYFKVLNLGGKPGLGGFYGQAGKPFEPEAGKEKKTKMGTFVMGEVEGVDGRMGQRGDPGKNGPPPIMEVISTDELDHLFELYGR